MKRFAMLLLICAGCVPVVRPPGPGPGPQPVPVSVEKLVQDAWREQREQFARIEEESAARIEADPEINPAQEQERVNAETRDVRIKSWEKLNEHLGREFGMDSQSGVDNWDPVKAVELKRRVARAHRDR